jgi:protein-serine/threonine kinase
MIANEVGLMHLNEGDSILRCHDIFDYRNRLWIIIDLMDGCLTDVIDELDAKYSENCVKYMCYKTLSGLQFLHERHIIHRDIKSDNVLYNEQGDVQLADFGFAVQLTEQKSARVTKVGTLHWMAPELIRGERKYSTSIDIWSFGIFAYELAMVEPPYATAK